MFKSMHIDHHQNNIKLVVISKSESSFEFTTIDCEAPPSDKGLTVTRRPLPPFERITPCNICILASFHGLVCLGISIDGSSNYFSDLILWNPLMNEYRRLPKSNYHRVYYSSNFGLYYSSCEDDYKLLLVTDDYESNVYVYSFKSDSWRKVDAFQHRSLLHHRRWSRGTYLNENLYFLQPHSNEGLSSIIRFDTKTERLSKIEFPSVDDYQKAYSETIMVKRGCIHICAKYIYINCDSGFEWTTCIKLWKLDEYDNLKEVVNYQLKPHDYIISNLRPFHLMKNGNWLMTYDCNKERCIYQVDLKEKKHIKDKSGNDKGNIYDDYELYASIRVDGINGIFADNVGYFETFVSPNQHMK